MDEPTPSATPADAIGATRPKTDTLIVEHRLDDQRARPGCALGLRINGRSTSHAISDASGTAHFSLSTERQDFALAVMATGNGLVSQAIQWVYDSNAPVPPDRLFFQMEKATSIRGRVIDQDQ